MKQTLHIFAKDVRHLWREIAATLLLVVLYGWHVVKSWEGPMWYTSAATAIGMFSLATLLEVASYLLPLAWIMLVVRAIYDESLVGDRQFWVTRPYDWRQLLASKILFAVTFISVPVFVLQLVLLPKAGFAPGPHVWGLIGMEVGTLLLLSVLFVLATVTAGFAQLALLIVGIVLYLIASSYVGKHILNSSFGDYSNGMDAVLGLIVGVGVLLLQYARRKTNTSRLMIGVFAVGILVIDAVFPYEHFINQDYPVQAASADVQLRLSLQPPKRSSGRIMDGDVMVMLPMNYEGVSEPGFLKIDGQRATITGSNGQHWDSGWNRGGMFLFADRKDTYLMFRMPRETFESMKDSPVQIQTQLALSQYDDRNQRGFIVPEGMFELEGAHCVATARSFGIQCRSALHQPEFVMVTSDLSKNTCPLTEGEVRANPGETARGYVYGSKPDWVQVGISPIETFTLALSDYPRADEHRPHGICPGTPVTVSDPRVTKKMQTGFVLKDVKLDDYAMRVGGGS